MADKKVAIVIPLSTTPEFSEEERLSIKHLDHYLGRYEKYFLAPESLTLESSEYPVLRFDDRYFGSLDAHNRFLLSKDFYQRFTDYDYILMHHLDCLIFKDELSKWCEKGYDFIGTPWIKGPDLPWLEEEGVGNGGLSLRRVEAFQKLLSSDIRWEGLRSKLKKLTGSQSINDFLTYGYNLLTCFLPSHNNINAHIDNYLSRKGNEDRFLHYFAEKYYPDFQIAPVDVALEFGFEANPRICFERNNHQLPFGCHAWEKFDKKFWKQFTLSEPSTEYIRLLTKSNLSVN